MRFQLLWHHERQGLFSKLLTSCGWLFLIALFCSCGTSTVTSPQTPTPTATREAVLAPILSETATPTLAPPKLPTPTPTPTPQGPSRQQVQQLADDLITSGLEPKIRGYDQHKAVLQIEEYFGSRISPDKATIYKVVREIQEQFWTSKYYFSSVTVFVMKYRETDGADQIATATLGHSTAQTINWTWTTDQDAWGKYDKTSMSQQVES
jgi:hypothetical protein